MRELVELTEVMARFELTEVMARFERGSRGARPPSLLAGRAAGGGVDGEPGAGTSLDALYRCLGLGRPNVRREKPPKAAPRSLDEAGQRRLLRAAEAAPVRPRALVMVMVMLFTALRISETVALDVDDVGFRTDDGATRARHWHLAKH
jgi:integrase